MALIHVSVYLLHRQDIGSITVFPYGLHVQPFNNQSHKTANLKWEPNHGLYLQKDNIINHADIYYDTRLYPSFLFSDIRVFRRIAYIILGHNHW